MHKFKLLIPVCFVLAQEVKTKYRNLRTYYVKQRNKERESQRSGASAQAVYSSSWKYYNELRFLDDSIVTVNPTTSSLTSVSSDQQMVSMAIKI